MKYNLPYNALVRIFG